MIWDGQRVTSIEAIERRVNLTNRGFPVTITCQGSRITHHESLIAGHGSLVTHHSSLVTCLFNERDELIRGDLVRLVAEVADQLGAIVFFEHIRDFITSKRRDDQ